MEKTIALFIVAVSLVYSDLASSHWFFGYVLPTALVLGLAYLLWLRPFLALSGAYFSYRYMDIGSQSWFNGLFLPLTFALCICYLLVWMGVAAIREQSSGFTSGDSGSDWGDWGGGDGSD